MTADRRALILGFAFLTACDPAAGVRVRTALAPAPQPSCVDSLLRVSPLVARSEEYGPTEAARRRGERILMVTFRASAGGHPTGILEIKPRTDSLAALAVRFSWMGTLDGYSVAQRAEMSRRGVELLDALRDACGSSNAREIVCEDIGWRGQGKPHACPTAI